MTKEKLEQALELLLSNRNNWSDFSDVAYTAVENLLEAWAGDFDYYETRLDETVHQEIETALVYYRDVYDYLEKGQVWNIEDAVNDGFGNNLSSIAYYFLHNEVYSILSKLGLY